MNLAEKIDQYLEKEFPNAATSTSTAVYRDLSLNFKKIMEDSPLDLQDRFLNLLAIATTLANESMMNFAKAELTEQGLPVENIQEAAEISGIMGMLNVYYKFKGYLSAEAAPNFTRTGLRMNSLSKPANGKEKFEMMSFSVSVVNGCPTCVSSHERALTQLGVDADRIHELARLAAVAKALDSLKTARLLFN